jgi:hypothetical protein
MSYSFAGGVRDTQGLRAFIPVQPGEVVGVNLANGDVLWRRSGIGRPVAATTTRLVTLDQDGKSFVLRLLNAETGGEVAEIKDFGMPDVSAQEAAAPDAVQIEAAAVPEGIRFAWRVRSPYRGGSPPPAHIAAKALEETTGAVVVDPTAARVVSAGASGSIAGSSTDSPAKVQPASPDPNVIALDQVGERAFALKAQAVSGQSMRITLEARDARNGSMLWEVPLAEGPARRPTPPRE